jgi:hypothetical protein
MALLTPISMSLPCFRTLVHFPRSWRRARPSRALLAWLAAAASLQITTAELSPRWRWSNPDPHGANLRALVHYEGSILQFAERGQIYASDPLYRWVPIASGTLRDLRAATGFGGKLIVTAEAGTVLILDSLAIEQVIDLQTPDWLEGVSASTAEVVAVGDRGAIYRSSNGLDWQRQSVPFTNWLTGIAYAPPVAVFTVVGRNGFIATSPDGRAWSRRNSGTQANLNRVEWLEDQFVAVGDAGTVLSSPTGTTWTPLASGATNALYTVAGDARSLLVAGQQELHAAIREGSNWAWTSQINGAHSGAPPWTYLSALRVAHSSTNMSYWVGGRTGLLVYGQRQSSTWTWAREDASLRNWLWDVHRAPDFYVAVGDRGNILTSDNGARWDLELVPAALTNSILLGVGGTTNQLLAVGNKGALAYSTSRWIDLVETNETGVIITNRVNTLGVLWESVDPPPTTNDLQAVTATANRYVVGGGRGTILTSPDGVDWTPRNSGTTNFLSSATAFPAGLVAAGENGTILVSEDDGTSWTPRDARTQKWLYRVRFLNGALVIAGEGGTLLHSPDAETWTAGNTGTDQWLNDVVWVAGRYYAAGAQGTLIVSTNLADWSDVGILTRKSIYGLSNHDGHLLAVGVEGIILRAPIAPQQVPPRFLSYSQTTNSNIFLIAGALDQRMTLDHTSTLGPDASWTSGPLLEIWSEDGTLIHRDPLSTAPPSATYFRLTVVPE